ncbi:MAG TPA: PIN domain-containing protein [Acetobacteraceae bacterium]
MLTIQDTNVLSELRLPSPDPNVATWFGMLDPDDVAIASFTMTEIEYGIRRLPASRTAQAVQLAAWRDAIRTSHHVLPFDTEAALVLGQMYANAALSARAATSKWPGFGGDLIIAATAIAHHACVATRNLADFAFAAQHFPKLTGIDPFTGTRF